MGSGLEARTAQPRRQLALAFGLVLCAMIAASALALEDARSTCLRSGSAASGCPGFPALQVTIGAAVMPRALPSHEMRPVALELKGKIAANGDSHPSALREMVMDLDRDIALDSGGLPVCHRGGRDMRRSLGEVAKLCDDAIVGHGSAEFEIEFPEQQPIRTASKVVVFNSGGGAAAVASFSAVAEVTVPAPTLIAMPIELTRIHTGAFGLRAVAKVPVVAGGSGSLLSFELELRRGFDRRGSRANLVTARCPDGEFVFAVPELLFRNETHTPGVAPTTLMRGRVAVPCLPLG